MENLTMAVPSKKTTPAPAAKVAKKQNALDSLGQLGQQVKPTAKKATKERNSIELDAATDEAFVKFSEANQVRAFVSEREDNLKNEVCEFALNEFSKTLFANKSRPGNPQLTHSKVDGRGVSVPDITAIFQVQDRFSVKLDESATPESAVEAFVAVGLPQGAAQDLVDNEIDFNPVTNTRPLNELVSGHYGENRQWIDATETEKELGERLLNLILENFQPDEINLIVKKQNSIKPKAGFLDRLAGYCESAEDVNNVFKVVKPINFISSVKFGINDDPQAKATRLIEATAEIVGAEAE